ncbi:ribosomal protein L31e family protein [Actinidia rufa]|uniref:Ribosomal protein L31e family protein n=1 Tax=Actinidia rufa TaxID=165716 RepID=A0A7J0DW44_9ERIC|nr:ribosomal protein L31e family protein [Actinidia rufa]
MVEKTKGRKEEVVTREYIINLPQALTRMVSTNLSLPSHLTRIITQLGIRSVPRRVRVRIARKRNDDEDAKEELYSLVTVAEIPAEGLKGLGTKVIEEDD